jgi:hypothetical protein
MVQVVPHFALDAVIGIKTPPANAVGYVVGSAVRGAFAVPRANIMRKNIQIVTQAARDLFQTGGRLIRAVRGRAF